VATRVLVIDNYDSFVFNLVQYLGELGADPVVHRNDALTVEEALALGADAVLLSPGPGRPEQAGIMEALIPAAAAQGLPVLGVCLGHQAIGHVYGGRIVAAPELMHGKTSWISHDGQGVFAGLPDPLEATRYHSLVVDREGLPDCFAITARPPTADHGPAPSGPAARGRAVPPRVDPDDGWPRPAGCFLGASLADARPRSGPVVVALPVSRRRRRAAGLPMRMVTVEPGAT
jgi:anthranilate synthase/aminodeoxychorismate synthase-like glutamine amidotransferase